MRRDASSHDDCLEFPWSSTTRDVDGVQEVVPRDVEEHPTLPISRSYLDSLDLVEVGQVGEAAAEDLGPGDPEHGASEPADLDRWIAVPAEF